MKAYHIPAHKHKKFKILILYKLKINYICIEWYQLLYYTEKISKTIIYSEKYLETNWHSV